MKPSDTRKPEHPINPLLLDRWSPRAMSGASISKTELLQLFEAAKWAPSSYNNQPWRFVYAEKESSHWKNFFNLLVEFNQQWCKNAAVLVVALSRKNFASNEKPARTHSFDAGAAWENLALQGTTMGLVVHAMEGFDYDKAKKELEIPDEYNVEAMIAIGKPGNKADLPAAIQEREYPSDRRKLAETIFEGRFSY